MKDLTLCIETSTKVCSVALAKGPEVLVLETISEPFQHASMITSLIEKCMSQVSHTSKFDRLGAIAISEGPGSFTGLRVGLSAAKGLCFALDLPLIGISTLKSLANGARSQFHKQGNHLYCSMIDARRMEVYCAIYNDDLIELMAPKAEILTNTSFNDWIIQDQEIVFIGNGAPKLMDLESFQNYEKLDLDCSAEYLAQLAHEKNIRKEYSDVTKFSPKYLKPPNITKPRQVI